MKPWSAKLPLLSGRALAGVGAGALVGSFYIGTGDIAIATKMGALFGMDIDGYTSAVSLDRHRITNMYRHVNCVAITCQGFINGVIDEFLHHVV